MKRDCPCACAVACLWPRNSSSNVVVSVTIHDNLKYLIIEIRIRDVARKNETIVEGRANRSLYLGLGGERQIEH